MLADDWFVPVAPGATAGPGLDDPLLPDAAPVWSSKLEYDSAVWWRRTAGSAYRMRPGTDHVQFLAAEVRSAKQQLESLKRDWPPSPFDDPVYRLANDPVTVAQTRWEWDLPIGRMLSVRGYERKDRPVFFSIFLGGGKSLCDVSSWKIGVLKARDIAFLLCKLVVDKELLPTHEHLTARKNLYLDELCRDMTVCHGLTPDGMDALMNAPFAPASSSSASSSSAPPDAPSPGP